MSTLFSILSVYAWVLVGCVICFLLHIARFYEKKYAELYDDAPRKRTFCQLFLIPLVLFLVAAVRLALLGDLAGDAWGDLALFAGGIVLIASSYHLHQLMTGGRR